MPYYVDANGRSLGIFDKAPRGGIEVPPPDHASKRWNGVSWEKTPEYLDRQKAAAEADFINNPALRAIVLRIAKNEGKTEDEVRDELKAQL
jgi:hypothetical protein